MKIKVFMKKGFFTNICSLFLFAALLFASLPAGLCEEAKTDNLSVFSLKNGMKVVLLEDHSSPVVALNVWVNVGSADEREDEAGLSHVYEHMLFKGTKKRGVGEVAGEIEAAGGDINAYTSHDNTVYIVSIASRYLDTALDILSDAIINPAFDPKELKKELEVILEEYKRSKDIPESELHKKVFKKSFRVHSYGRPVIGYEKTIKGLTRDKMLEYFNRWYVPKNMFLVVAGDFDKSILIPKIENAFGKFERGGAPLRQRSIEPKQQDLRSIILEGDVKKAHLNLAFHIPEAKHKDTYALDALALILGQGESSRLFQKIKVQKELVNSIYSYSISFKDPGLFLVEASLEKNRVQGALENILSELSKLKVQTVSSEELERAKINLKSDFIYKKETMQGQVRSLGFFQAVFGDISYQKKYLDEIDRITKKDILRVARRYLSVSNMTAGVLLPKDVKGLIEEKDIRRITAEVDKKFRDVKNDRIQKGIVKKRLDNGLTLIIKENHSVPIVAIKGVFLGGVRFENRKNNGVSHFVAEMLTKGTKTRSSLDIANEIESIAGGISGFSGRNSIGVEATVLSQYFDKGMELFSDVLLNPSFDKEELEKKRREIVYNIHQQEDNLIQSTAKMFYSALFERHPYGMPTLGSIESVNALKESNLKDFYSKYIVPGNMILTIVGDIESDEAAKKAEDLFGKWSGKDFTLPQIPEEKPVQAIRKKEKLRDKKQTHIILGFRGTTFQEKDRYPLEVLDSLLSGQGGRLFLELRDKESLAYSVSSFNRLGIDPGYFGFYIATSPEKETQAITGIKREITKIREKPVSDKELERAKRSLIGGYEIALQTNASQASDIAFNEIYGLGYDEFSRYPQKISEVTVEDVQRVARKYLDLNTYALAIIKPQ